MTAFGILGELRIEGVSVGGQRRRSLLALLLSRAGTTTPLDRICDELWEGAPTSGAMGTVRTYLSQFRKFDVPWSVESHGSAYGLRLDRSDLDATAFADQLVAVRGRVGEDQLTLLEEALDLWSGPPLEEFRGAEWADRAALPLEELHRRARVDRLELLAEIGRLDAALAGCAAASAEDPLDERVACLLALVRYRMGRVSEALRSIATTRRMLSQELGVDPGPELVDLERRMLDRDPSLEVPRAAVAATAAPVGTSGGVNTELPDGTVTFLFTDIVGSTSLNRAVGDERYAELLRRHRAVIQDRVEATGGRIFGTEGDATFAVFAGADDACRAAVGLVRELRDEPWEAGAGVTVRVGLHSGRALVVDDDYTGATVHLAARVASTAHSEQIVASDTTVSLTPDLDWRDLGVHRLKDIERPQRIRQLVAPDLPQDFPPLPTAANVPTNLPDPRDEFVGRESDVDEVLRALDEGALTTLVGPGGVGKTRLAVEAARKTVASSPGGVHYIALAGVATDGGVEPAVRRAMSLPDRSGLDLSGSVDAATAGEAALLVLDNCEHVLDGAAAVTAELLDGCPATRVLCTSREPLRIRGERVQWVEPLPVSAGGAPAAAERLFIERAEAATGRSIPDADVSLVRQLVAALDGLPLAIELAAARTRGLALVDVVHRLDDRFRLLRTGHRGGDDRHQTLESVIEWSHELLTPPDRLLFNRLSVFEGTFSLGVAEEVCSDDRLGPNDVVDGMGRLVEKSLVQLDSGLAGSRYRLLDTIRAFGLRRLDVAGGRGEMEHRLVDWVMALVDRLERDMRTEHQDRTIRVATAERGVARSALSLLRAGGHDEDALRVVASVPVDVPRERIRRIDELLPKVGDEHPDAAGRANLAAANLAVEMGAMQAGVDYGRAARRIYRGLHDETNEAWGAFLESFATWATGDLDGARTAIDDSLDAFERLGHAIGSANASWMRASMAEDLDDALRWGVEAERRCRAIDAPTALAHCLEVRALIGIRRDERRDVAGWLGEALDVFTGLRHEGCTAHVLEAVAAASASTHPDPTRVAEMLGAADRLRQVSGHSHRPWELAGHSAAVTALTPRLGGDDLARAIERGREHTLDSAATSARRLLDDLG